MEEFEPVQPADPNDPNLGASSVPHLPPSNLEIKIRTMAADIESVGKGGGFLGIAQKISLSIPREGIAPQKDVPVAPDVAPKSKTGKYILIGIGGALALFALGYFLPILFAGNSGKPGTIGNEPATTTTAEKPNPVPPVNQVEKLEHKSFFVVQPDAILPFFPATSSDLSLRDQWLGVFKFATGTITETQFGSQAGEYLSFPDFLSVQGVAFSAANILQTDFEKDFTSFIYRDPSGLWPGLILKLKSDVNPLLARGDISRFELEGGFITSLFASPTGNRDLAFKDSQLSGLPVRELGFQLKPAAFVYGLTRDGYLILATSEEAFKSALSRL